MKPLSPICPTFHNHCNALQALIDAKAPDIRIYVLCLVCLTHHPARKVLTPGRGER